MKHIFEYLFSKKSDLDKIKPVMINKDSLKLGTIVVFESGQYGVAIPYEYFKDFSHVLRKHDIPMRKPGIILCFRNTKTITYMDFVDFDENLNYRFLNHPNKYDITGIYSENIPKNELEYILKNLAFERIPAIGGNFYKKS